jgi:hypothetical protein
VRGTIDTNSRAPLDSATETLLETVRALTGTSDTGKLGADQLAYTAEQIQARVGTEVTLKDGQKHIITQAEANAAKALVKNAKPEDVGTATGLTLKVDGDGTKLRKPASDKPEAKDKSAPETATSDAPDPIVITARNTLTQDGRRFGQSVVNVTTDLHQGYESQSKPVQFLIDIGITAALGSTRPVISTLAGYGVGATLKYWPEAAGGNDIRDALGNLNRSVGAVAASGLTDESYQGTVQDYVENDKTTIRQTDALAWGTTTLLGDSFVKSVNLGLQGLAGTIGAAGVSLNGLRRTDNAAGSVPAAKPDTSHLNEPEANWGQGGNEVLRVGEKSYPLYTGNKPLFRGDTRSIDEIFTSDGFAPLGTNTDLKDHVYENSGTTFVSTTESIDIARQSEFTNRSGYVYEIDPSKVKGIDVNVALGNHRLANELEVAILGGVPGSAIKQAWPVNKDGTLGKPIPNPHYVSGK